MPKNGTRAEVNTFVKGLITEASPLNFPANASFNELNFELNRDGTRNRRLGLDYEPSYLYRPSSAISTSISTYGINTFKWVAAGGDSSKEFIVIQIGALLYFYDNRQINLSLNGFINTVDVTLPFNVKYSFDAVDGKLVVVAGTSTICVVTYTPISNSFSASYLSLTVRDVWGVEEVGALSETDPSTRPGILTDLHLYNLQNQSWGVTRKNSANTLVSPEGQYNTDLGVFPSNSEVVWTGLAFQPVAGATTPYERIYTNLYQERIAATSLAGKGYFIIDFLKRGTSRIAAVQANRIKYPGINTGTATDLGLKADFTDGGATIVTEFAGRVFFGGFNGASSSGDARTPTISNYLLFSKLVRNTQDINKCYQEGDPTSRDSSDIVDTDGGFIRIAGANNLIAARNLGTHLVVLADNGVWAVTGGNNYGFSATNYKVDKISSYGCLSEGSVVVDGGQLLFWSRDGIYAVSKNQYGDLGVNNITAGTIQSFYDLISPLAKLNVRGVYDLYSKKIKWIYREGNLFDVTNSTHELILDTQLQAFYVYQINKPPDNSVEILSGFPTSVFQQALSVDSVLDDTLDVINNVDSVVVTSDSQTSGLQAIKYLTLHINQTTNNIEFTFSGYINTQWRDWQQLDTFGVDAKAFVITGATTANDAAIDKQIPYITMYFRRTENGVDSFGVPLNSSSCKLRAMWDFSNSTISKKWSKLMETYRPKHAQFSTSVSDTFENGFDVVVTKNKLRGNGKAFSLYMETSPDKDCNILGWSITLNGNAIT